MSISLVKWTALHSSNPEAASSRTMRREIFSSMYATPCVRCWSRSLRLKLEEIRLAQVRRLQEARRTEQARRLEQEASRIADLLNRDFETMVGRLQGIQAAASTSASALAIFGAKGPAGSEESDYVEGIQTPATIESADKRAKGGRGSGDRESPNVPRRASARGDGDCIGRSCWGRGGEQESQLRGGFRVAYRELGEREYRSRYDPSTLTILINLDHAAVKNALSAAEEGTQTMSAFVCDDLAFQSTPLPYEIGIAIRLQTICSTSSLFIESCERCCGDLDATS